MAAQLLAFKHVALAVMLAEINYCSSNLHLPLVLPVQEHYALKPSIYDPSIIGFAGCVELAEYNFCFSGTGRLQFIVRREPGRGKLSLVEYCEQLAEVKSVITTNDAYRIATNWLTTMEVELDRLEREKPHFVQQQSFKSAKHGPVMLPIFYVTWGEAPHSAISVTISGVNGELIRLMQDDVSYSKRPVSLIKNLDQVLGISDSEFAGYTAVERSNLVARFAAVSYPVTPNSGSNQPPAPVIH